MHNKWTGCGDEIYLLIENLSHEAFNEKIIRYYFENTSKIERYKKASITTACIEIPELNLSQFVIGMNEDFIHDPMFEPTDIVQGCFPNAEVLISYESNLHIISNGKSVFTLFGEDKEGYYKNETWKGQPPQFDDFLVEEDGYKYVEKDPVETFISYKYKNKKWQFGKSVFVYIIKDGEKVDDSAILDQDIKDIDYWRFTESFWDLIPGEKHNKTIHRMFPSLLGFFNRKG